jgi:hypothetical protein
MNRDIICNWLGLADKRWPPDPYALLGLTAAECNRTRIEERVHERMAKLRSYQLSHPDEATEGMNRVAQAFITLVERHGASAAAPSAPAPPAPTPSQAAATEKVNGPLTPVPRALSDTAVAERTHLDWKAGPPPVRDSRHTPRAPIPISPPEPPAERPAEPEPRAVESEEQIIRSLAEDSEQAREAVLTLQAVMTRADLTRQLLIAWRKAGRYLANPRRKLTRPVEKTDFSRKMEALHEAAEPYPDFVAHLGRPGYRAVALAHLGIPPDVFNAMGDEPREQLARDWQLAHKILLAHRIFLLTHFKVLRRRGSVGRCVHTLRISYRSNPTLWRTFGIAVGIVAVLLIAVMLLAPHL